MPSDYYCVDVWRIPLPKGKYKYEGVFISRPEAMNRTLRGDASFVLLQKPHPAAKLLISLCKNDIIVLSNEEEYEFCRIAGFATTRNKIDIRPLYASDTISKWKNETNDHLTSTFWPIDVDGQYFKSINVLFEEFLIKLVKITVDGIIIYRS
jgi:hypothetical protein